MILQLDNECLNWILVDYQSIVRITDCSIVLKELSQSIINENNRSTLLYLVLSLNNSCSGYPVSQILNMIINNFHLIKLVDLFEPVHPTKHQPVQL